jgi:hypothetical protein
MHRLVRFSRVFWFVEARKLLEKTGCCCPWSTTNAHGNHAFLKSGSCRQQGNSCSL